jgi:hypothetical protein
MCRTLQLDGIFGQAGARSCERADSPCDGESTDTRRRISGLIPFGFDEDGSGNLIVNAGEQAVVKSMKAMRSRGWSYHKIADKLNEDRIKSKAGKRWYAASVRGILRRAR